MQLRVLLLGSMCAVPAAAAADALPDIICAPTDVMYQRLEREYFSERRGTGVRAPDEILEIWEAPKSGNWTLLKTYASGRSCIVAMGEDWHVSPPGQS